MKHKRQIQRQTAETQRKRAEYLLKELRKIGYECIPTNAGLLIRKAAA